MTKNQFLFLCSCPLVFLFYLSCTKDEHGVSANANVPSSTPVESGLQADPPSLDTVQLMTAQDILNQAYSNISIRSGVGSSVTASGLFIASYDVNDCSACFGGIVSGDNAGGAIVTPITFPANQSLKVGQNYLYNLLYNGIYYIKNTAGSSPCQLPGCSWPGDDPNVSGWCITINVMSRHSPYTSSTYANGANPPANVVAYSNAGNSNPFGYKFDLIDPNTLGIGNACLGLIACNDQTLTCSVSSPQSETFQAY